ncbi:C40 family peptidase [Neobacillus pocheonensis]|uniref:C40 family peptidase n=1 Tax=Neobacillus pocheonensis TaxID=363869 RepID=A0ABT0WDT4_9BACI|nr:C40 family peptidase [Neobacillus pocheonensis]
MTGTAQAQYNKTRPIPEDQIKPGDLVFFSTYKPGPSHVGMYVGNGQFINANDSGISYSSVKEWKKLYPFLRFRRIQ